MLHIVYILAFTIIAFLAIGNLIRSLITLSTESQRRYPPVSTSSPKKASSSGNYSWQIHPELLDEKGKPLNEPLLVMRSVSVEDARKKLDDIYDSSPNQTKETEEGA